MHTDRQTYGRTDRRGATLNVAPTEGRIIIKRCIVAS